MSSLYKTLWVMLAALMLAACQPAAEPESGGAVEGEEAVAVESSSEAPVVEVETSSERLAAVLADQVEAMRERYDQRHPQETLEFFGIEPGMTVMEALPGGGWYSRILRPYLGSEGRLIGANYPIRLFQQFDFATPEFLESIANWPETFPEQAAGWCEGDCAPVSAFWIGDMPTTMVETADAVLFIRALHNMARFQKAGIEDFLDQAMTNAFDVLKPGGVMGVVQHEADESMSDDWASGEAGYLKRSFVIAAAEAAGFELEAASDINANPADQPSESDVVWRLPPSLGTTEEGSEERAAMEAIGESNRMTLRFRKPVSVF
ncbi:class I SAM-dependent methyltransferase [Wenzhouxiangella marina]|uniref:Methyltransferase n=1 Tax=Wenzhouxiangella marina TaxID=1579979 RepID=A0A0K0XZ97_9GAMM|nr:class I SAM-dependent methyltransferase [Wenzhouxiangella marina]AKS42995.1 methyltransferase [Wenzhouxiangella marina]MBB6087322.1 putative methyltransferase [Wenzhouxiangella marina]